MWKVQGKEPYRIRDQDGTLIAKTFEGDEKANAELIVKAVNSHDELVEALKPFAEIDLWKNAFGSFELYVGSREVREIFSNITKQHERGEFTEFVLVVIGSDKPDSVAFVFSKFIQQHFAWNLEVSVIA